ncbi:MAG: cupin domain-containing protein [Methylophilaceae bacterium]|nr:cupin domain-containing protein [Methylophilaceae bacterium]
MPTHQQPLALLGNITPTQFLAEYWQKKPLLIRNAIANFTGLLDANELAGLSCKEDVQARLIKQSKSKWQVIDGPFDEDFFSRLPHDKKEHNWTLLVQSVNHHLPKAAELLAKFNFIPHARLDDLMVSYAPDGGGVGPHFDSYDVFLLQGSGKRLWRVCEQQDLSLVDGVPIKILKNFVTEQEYILEAGDMLYLPPQVAHWGVAMGECMTYSIGFRAPKVEELAIEFLSFMQDNLALQGLYQDPNLTLQAHPSDVSDNMVASVSNMLKTITWDDNAVGEFLGRYLSDPKPDVIFELPRKLSLEKFNQQLMQKPIFLALKSKMLCYKTACFINGEKLDLPDSLFSSMQKLADTRCLFVNHQYLNIDDLAVLIQLLHTHYLSGYLTFKH